MSERLKNANNFERLNFNRFALKKYEVKDPKSFSFETLEGIYFEILLKKPPEASTLKNISLQTIQSIARYSKENSNWNLCPREQSYEHFLTETFLCTNWKFILSITQLAYQSGEIFCYPEVTIQDPKNVFKNIPVDLLGYDGNGTIHAGEISSLNRKGKFRQLKRNVKILESLYPEIHFSGFLAFYKGVARNKIEIDLNFFDRSLK